MANMPLGEQTLYIGIDGGGTKCRASIMTADFQVLGTGVGGPANPFHGIQQAKDSIRSAAELALSDAGLPPSAMSGLVAGAGLACHCACGFLKFCPPRRRLRHHPQPLGTTTRFRQLALHDVLVISRMVLLVMTHVCLSARQDLRPP